ncbi:DUF3685 domain-containing protein [Prochlorococcus marinus]|uniref:CheY-like domain containing protein n=1 Tax=Prochlorococcus marinus (strain MIT 9211) TaxID=93059 RepID=A9BAN5_PROM4|nr:DUF3685 domain-containing protein [Prochlorococcus marinus]ABX08897.1 conserved hypothetical protein [Prochlorococcus marinus str. MIT 9211]
MENYIEKKLTEGGYQQILLLAPSLLGESLAAQLQSANKSNEIILRQENLTKAPALVIWAIDNVVIPSTIRFELRTLSERWAPSPILLLLPSKTSIPPNEILNFESDGILQDPDIKTLVDSISTILEGGRVFQLKQAQNPINSTRKRSIGIGQYLLKQGIDQIDMKIAQLEPILSPLPINPFLRIAINGRKRELNSAKNILIWVWGPIHNMPISDISAKLTSDIDYIYDNFVADIVLPQRDSKAVIELIITRLRKSVSDPLSNSTGTIFALQAITECKQKTLLLELITQLEKLLLRLISLDKNESKIIDTWNSFQLNLRKEAIRSIAEPYTTIEYEGNSVLLRDRLEKLTELDEIDEDMPSPKNIVQTLILNESLKVDDQYLPYDHPKSVIRTEMILTNWLIRTAEIISSELLNQASIWPDLRQYLLTSNLISTRELERLRNQLNSQSRIQSLFTRPIHLYESKRLLYRINQSSIESYILTELRDKELRELGWLQKQVTLLVEARDALAPQIQSLVKYIGNFMVILLTNVLGRAIGLVGKGIAQGMGRSLSR